MLKAIYLEGSNVTPDMDAVRFDIDLGLRSAVVEGMTNKTVVAGQPSFTFNAGLAFIEGIAIRNDSDMVSSAFPNNVVEVEMIMCLFANRTSGKTVVSFDWFPQSTVDLYTKDDTIFSLHAENPANRKQMLPLLVARGTNVMKSAYYVRESYRNQFIGGGGDYGGHVLRVYPHTLRIGSNVNGTPINVTTTSDNSVLYPMQNNEYYCTPLPSYLGVKIRKTGFYRIHAHATVSFNSQSSTGRRIELAATVNKVGSTQYQNPNRPDGSATKYNIASVFTNSNTSNVDGSAVVTLFKDDVLSVGFEPAFPAYPSVSSALHSRYEVEYISTLPATIKDRPLY